jgi:pimeloyl-ACP methyl ester carboxylesterase
VTVLLLIAMLLTGSWLYAPDKDRAELEALYAAPPSSFITVSGLRMHVRDTGARDAPAVLLLHGFGASLHTWDAWAVTLEKTHRVIRVDLPGAALTGADPTGDYSDDRAVQLLLALLDELQLPQAIVVGHSMGGRIAWKLAAQTAAQQPQRVSHLVLIAPDGARAAGSEDGVPTSPGLAARLLQVALPKTLVRSGLASAYADPQALSEATVGRYHDLLLAPQVRAAMLARLSQRPSALSSDAARGLSPVSLPVLLLWGERDRLIAPTRAQDFLRLMPQARLVLLPGVGHLPHEEAPATSLPVLLSFLLSHPAQE